MLNFDDPEIYQMLLDVCKGYSVDPSASLETEELFRKLLESYSDEREPSRIASWLREQILQHFVAVSERPHWLQASQWPFDGDGPMIFAGQIDLPIQNGGIVSEIYHDDTSIYIFIGRRSRPKVVVQQL